LPGRCIEAKECINVVTSEFQAINPFLGRFFFFDLFL